MAPVEKSFCPVAEQHIYSFTSVEDVEKFNTVIDIPVSDEMVSRLEAGLGDGESLQVCPGPGQEETVEALFVRAGIEIIEASTNTSST